MNGMPNLRSFSFCFLGGRYDTDRNCTVLASLSLFLSLSCFPFNLPFAFLSPYIKNLETRITYSPLSSPLEKQRQTRYSLQRL